MARRDSAQALHDALRHPLRRRLLRRYVESDQHLSPRELARLERAPLSSVSYHVRELFRLEAIVVSEIRPVSGSLQHFYLLADRVKETPWVLETLGLEGRAMGRKRGEGS